MTKHREALAQNAASNAAEGSLLRDYEDELRAKGNTSAASRVAKSASKFEDDAEFWRDRLRDTG
ncbi:hypothetical protein [Nonomuraea typhae]|uniref:Antitoxin n=1 Tax=Nonomuraea typhae TaxID=2603600 RepID=A0ABW7YM24_9ACTN